MAKLGSEWIGHSVSHATLREADLIPAFEAVLDIAGVVHERPESAGKLILDQPLTNAELKDVGFYLNETLFDLLDGIAPEGTYFGAHPGDGSDYGFWPCEED